MTRLASYSFGIPVHGALHNQKGMRRGSSSRARKARLPQKANHYPEGSESRRRVIENTDRVPLVGVGLPLAITSEKRELLENILLSHFKEVDSASPFHSN
ncbi:hypothetical protein Tco_0715431 [Tanacetum coccineum]